MLFHTLVRHKLIALKAHIFKYNYILKLCKI
jgi:hypothetical protein